MTKVKIKKKAEFIYKIQPSFCKIYYNLFNYNFFGILSTTFDI